MQPFDALSIRAVLTEARPLIVNRRVDRVMQLGRDEVLIALRGKMGMTNLFISAQSVHGRLCLVQNIQAAKSNNNAKDARAAYDPLTDRYVSKYGNNSSGTAIPNFCLLLRKHLAGAVLIAADQPIGERIVDLVFSCTDEVGTTSIKILTAEIMGRHSNLVFWDKESGKVICASHNVTKDMSRQREIAAGLRYERPPSQDRPSLYTIEEAAFVRYFDEFIKAVKDTSGGAAEAINNAAPITPVTPVTIEQWLIATFTGAGRHLCEEIVAAAGLPSEAIKASTVDGAGQKLLAKIVLMRSTDSYKPFMLADLTRYSVLGWLPTEAITKTTVKNLPSVNDLIEVYFRSCEINEQCNQLRERLKTELSQEFAKIDARVKMASAHVQGDDEIGNLKKYGDLILAHLKEIEAGQELLEVEDIFTTTNTDVNIAKIKIKLNPNISTAQNAQAYYRQYAKNRARHGAASQSVNEAMNRRATLQSQMAQVDQARDLSELRALKENLSGKKAARHRQAQGQIKKGRRFEDIERQLK